MRAGLPGLARESGAIYLDDFFDQPYRLKVLQDTAIYYNSDLARFLGTLRRGQLVELQAVNDKRGLLRVRGLAGQGQVVGWVEARFVSALDPEFVVGLRRSVERREQIRALTASGEIALGMTMEEVATSLGQPVKKSSHADASGVVETWDYVHYVTVPRTVNSYDGYGRIYTAVAYVRVAAGSFSASFTNGVVSAVDRNDVKQPANALPSVRTDEVRRTGRVRVVVAGQPKRRRCSAARRWYSGSAFTASHFSRKTAAASALVLSSWKGRTSRVPGAYLRPPGWLA